MFHKPDVVKEIFAGDPATFHAGKGNAILGPVMGEHSLLLVDGATHKRARKLLMPAFNGHALRGYQEVVTGLAKTEVGTWRAGEEFRSLDRMNALTLEVILQVVFGVTDEQRLAELRPWSTGRSTSTRSSSWAGACRGCRASGPGDARWRTRSGSTA